MSTSGITRFEIEDEGGSIVGSTGRGGKPLMDKVEKAVKSASQRRSELVDEIYDKLPVDLVHRVKARPHLINLVRIACLHADDYGIGKLAGRVLVGRRPDGRRYVQASVMGADCDGAEVNCATVYLDKVSGVMVDAVIAGLSGRAAC